MLKMPQARSKGRNYEDAHCLDTMLMQLRQLQVLLLGLALPYFEFVY